jgi:murein endopeptidase
MASGPLRRAGDLTDAVMSHQPVQKSRQVRRTCRYRGFGNPSIIKWINRFAASDKQRKGFREPQCT